MLLISRISNLEMHSEAWKKARIGRLFTSSSIHLIMGEKGLGETGMSYIRRKVYEAKTGLSTDKEIDTDAVRHGLLYEVENGYKFAEKMGIEFMVTQKMIEVDATESITPDFIIVRKKSLDGLSYDCTPVECKCYQYEKHMKCAEATTAQEIKEVDRPAYFQSLHQMICTGGIDSFVSYFEPNLPVDDYGLNIIHFKKAQRVVDEKGKVTHPILDDIILMEKRKAEALKIFNDLMNKKKPVLLTSP